MAFIFSGIVWAQLTRRAHSLRTSMLGGEETEGFTGVRDETESADLEDQFRDISSFGRAGHDKRKSIVARRGVRAIFSSDEDWSTGKHEGSRISRISTTMLVNSIGWGLFLVVYALLVREYTSSVYMQSWIRANFGFGAYLLNYYALLGIAMM